MFGKIEEIFVFGCIFASVNKSVIIMKVKLTTEQIQKIVDDPAAAAEAKIKTNDPWWIIVVKVIAYICGLILAGSATAGCATAVAHAAAML